MSIAIELGRESVRSTYDAAADHFDEGPLSFWDRFGRRTVARLDLPDGASVLDVGCGTGATAILAAELVGREGRVVGVDLSARMVMRARAKARARGVHHAHFVVADMGELEFPDESFDAVISAFSIFFVPDMAAQVRRLWRLVRPGGQLAVTTWGPRSFEPASSAWRRAVEHVCPGTVPDLLPRDRLAGAADVRRLLADADIPDAKVVAEESQQPLRSPEDWWTMVLGTGARRVIDRMTPQEAARVKQVDLAWLEENGIRSVETNVIYAIATRERYGSLSWVI
jgi:ubiquinone/menaquinone biosynthesis C-methylase UbiE